MPKARKTGASKTLDESLGNLTLKISGVKGIARKSRFSPLEAKEIAKIILEAARQNTSDASLRLVITTAKAAVEKYQVKGQDPAQLVSNLNIFLQTITADTGLVYSKNINVGNMSRFLKGNGALRPYFGPSWPPDPDDEGGETSSNAK